MQFSETGGDEDMFCWLMEKRQTFLATWGWVIGQRNKNA